MEHTNNNLPNAVDAGEMAFAIAMFVGAAKGQVGLPPLSASNQRERDQFQEPAGESETRQSGSNGPAPGMTLLNWSLFVVWSHYQGDARRANICTRLVAFYSMMILSRGAAVARWVRPSNEDGTIVLDPAIIEVAGTASMSEDGHFDPSLFAAAVEAISTRRALETATHIANVSLFPELRAGASFQIGEIIRTLNQRLLDCEGHPSLSEYESGHPLFRDFEKMRGPIVAVSGSRAFQSLALRAVLTIELEFPWIHYAQLSPNGDSATTEGGRPNLSALEAAKGEVAVIGSFVGFLRTLLGDGVTVGLLRTVWPEAF